MLRMGRTGTATMLATSIATTDYICLLFGTWSADPKGAVHRQGNEEGLLYEYAYETEHIKGGGCMNLAERYKSFRCFKMEMGMESTLIPYQDRCIFYM